MANESGRLYDVFISYSSEDEAKANNLVSRLTAQGLKVWFAPSNIRGGDIFPQEIEMGLQKSQTVVAVLSNSSVNSFWVKIEWTTRLVQMSKDKTLKLIPLLIDDCDISPLRNTFHHIDFRNVDFNDTQELEDKVQELVDSIREVLPPPGTTVIGIPVAVVAMTQAEAKELTCFEVFKEDKANKDQLNRFKKLFDALKELKLHNFVGRYAINREDYHPFKSDNRTIREIIEEMAEEINQNYLVGRELIIRPQYYSNDFFSNDSEIRVRTWEYLDHHGCILILDGISMFHPKIQSKFLLSELGSKEHASLVCISPQNPRDYELNKILEYEMQEKLQRAFVRYHRKLDPQCSFDVGDERTLVRWLYSILPGVVNTVRQQKANPMMRKIVRDERGQPAGMPQLIFGER
jgi:hypothetical protein